MEWIAETLQTPMPYAFLNAFVSEILICLGFSVAVCPILLFVLYNFNVMQIAESAAHG
jgi:hypothetical protein